jgi:two-component system, NarL family, nitrate/nitrite response regulator NarL
MPNTIRIAAVDDHPLVRGGLERALHRVKDIKLIAVGKNAADASRIAEEHKPDVMLLDITMPGDGIEAARSIVASGAPTKIIMLTGSDDDCDVAAALAAGAKGYVVKGSETVELLDAVRAVHVNRPYITAEVAARVLVQTVHAPVPPSAANGEDGRLNDREEEILEHVARGMTNREIADQLNLSVPSVKGRIARIIRKMEVRNHRGDCRALKKIRRDQFILICN